MNAHGQFAKFSSARRIERDPFHDLLPFAEFRDSQQCVVHMPDDGPEIDTLRARARARKALKRFEL